MRCWKAELPIVRVREDADESIYYVLNACRRTLAVAASAEAAVFDDLVCLDCDGDAPLTLARRQPQTKQYHSRGIDAGSELVALATTPLHDYG